MQKQFLFLFLLIFSFVQVGFGQYSGYDLSNIVVTPGATNPVKDIVPRDENQLTADSTLDIVNWNVSWMGAPQMNSYKYGTRTEQINGIAQKLVEANADVYALQEVVIDAVNGNSLDSLLLQMNLLAGSNKYSGVYSKYYSFYWQAFDSTYPPQCLAYIWNNDVVTVNNDSVLLQDETSMTDFTYGRLPFLLDANVRINGKIQRYMFVNIHLKAKTGYSEERANAMKLLKQLLNLNFAANNVVLLGDFNVADGSGAVGEISDWGMYDDENGDGITDYVHAAGNKSNGIEHILISNNLFDELAYSPEYFWNKAISGTGVKLSDHYAYETRLYVHEETGNTDPEKNSLFATGNEFTMSTSDYQIIVSYVKNNPQLAALDNSKYEDSEDYFGASSYYSNFDVRDGKYNSSFSTWQEAVQSAISLALLPSKFPEAVASNDVNYSVTFKAYTGSTIQTTFDFVCTKSAPDPEFAYSKTSSIPVFSELGKVQLSPNPAKNQLKISSEEEIVSLLIFNQSGQAILNERNNLGSEFSVNISQLDQGIYFIRTISENGVNQVSKFIKQ
jgi:endonuclease/exonuclease/phosphatase family metal-dependent hydrolase